MSPLLLFLLLLGEAHGPPGDRLRNKVGPVFEATAFEEAYVHDAVPDQFSAVVELVTQVYFLLPILVSSMELGHELVLITLGVLRWICLPLFEILARQITTFGEKPF